MHLLRSRVVVVAVMAGVVSASCWGDEVPSLDRVGAMRSDDGEASILFGACPGEVVERVELNLTDDDFEEIDRVLWSIEADEGGSTESLFTVGEVPSGFREATALDQPLNASDHVQVVITSSRRNAIPMSFVVEDLSTEEVLVRQDDYRTRAEFDDGVEEACRPS